MGYESLEKDSLITLESLLSVFVTSNGEETQLKKDAKYELSRIRTELAMYD